MAKGGYGGQSRRSMRLGVRDPRTHRDPQQALDETITLEAPLAVVTVGREKRLGLSKAALVRVLDTSNATAAGNAAKINELIRSLAAAGLIEDPGG